MTTGMMEMIGYNIVLNNLEYQEMIYINRHKSVN